MTRKRDDAEAVRTVPLEPRSVHAPQNIGWRRHADRAGKEGEQAAPAGRRAGIQPRVVADPGTGALTIGALLAPHPPHPDRRADAHRPGPRLRSAAAGRGVPRAHRVGTARDMGTANRRRCHRAPHPGPAGRGGVLHAIRELSEPGHREGFPGRTSGFSRLHLERCRAGRHGHLPVCDSGGGRPGVTRLRGHLAGCAAVVRSRRGRGDGTRGAGSPARGAGQQVSRVGGVGAFPAGREIPHGPDRGHGRQPRGGVSADCPDRPARV